MVINRHRAEVEIIRRMEEVIGRLERAELEGGPDGIRVEGYMELLGYYLLQGDLCNAKFLWKRIPPAMKQHVELTAVWAVGQRLWHKDMPGFYTAAKAFQWSPAVATIVNQLVDSTRDKTTQLIGTAYTTIRAQDVATLLGLTLPETESLVGSHGWTISPDGMILPKEAPSVDAQVTSAEEQIAKLTDYVTFLEN